MDIQAIDTVFGGHRYRSRLEARWGFLFTELSIEYEYELEGLDIGGVWYLPDFWLPKQQRYVEVKPSISLHISISEPQPDEDKATHLANAGQRAAVCFGDPLAERIVLLEQSCRRLGSIEQLLRTPIEDLEAEKMIASPDFEALRESGNRLWPWRDRIARAAKGARQTRFEDEGDE